MRVTDSAGAEATRTQPMPIRALLLLVAALALCAVVAWGLIVPGPFDWAVSQPQSWQGGAEAALLLALLALLQGASVQRWRLPARLEDFPTIALSRPEYVADLDAARRHARLFPIRCLFPPKPVAGSDAASQLIHGCTPHSTPPQETRWALENGRHLLLKPVVPDSG